MALLPPNPVLEPLHVLIGDWAVEVPQFPGAMTLEDRSWKIWRDAPGFFQRFSGIVSEDGSSIRASWEKSADGTAWEHDFDLIYTRV